MKGGQVKQRTKVVRAWQIEGTGEGWGEMKLFSPSLIAAPVPVLASLVFQWLVLPPQFWEKQHVYRKQTICASHSLTGLEWRQKLALSAAEKAPDCFGCVSTVTHFFPPLPPSLVASPSPPHPQLCGCLRGIYCSCEGCSTPWSCWGYVVAKSLGTNPQLMLSSLTSLGCTEDI